MLQKAQVVAARNAFADLYQHKVTIYEKQKVINPIDHSTDFKEVALINDEPCRIDFDNSETGTEDKGVVVAPQTITLFIRPDLVIKAGSKIRVTYTDMVSGVEQTKDYSRAGEPIPYNTHQEIPLKLFDKYV